jgi:hypothetical protein
MQLLFFVGSNGPVKKNDLTRIMLNDNDLNLSKMAIIFIPYKGFEMIEFINLSSEFKTILLRTMSSK